MMYREEYYKQDTTAKEDIAEVIIGKHRNDPTGVIGPFTILLAWLIHASWPARL